MKIGEGVTVIPGKLPEDLARLRAYLIEKLAAVDAEYRSAAAPIILEIARLDAMRGPDKIFIASPRTSNGEGTVD